MPWLQLKTFFLNQQLFFVFVNKIQVYKGEILNN